MLNKFTPLAVGICLICLIPGTLRGQDADPATAGAERREDPALSPQMIQLRAKVRRTLAHYFHRPENNVERSPWGVMHCIIGFGVDTPLLVNRQRVNAIAWLCANEPCYSMRMMYLYGGQLRLRMGPGYQGHEGQFFAILAQSRVKIDYPLLVDGRQLSVADLVEYEKSTCVGGTELTFKLIGLSHYLDSDSSWQTPDGQAWDIARLVREELAQPVIGACCGGTHRLTGFSYAVRGRQREGKPIDGQWGRAQQYLEDYHRYVFRLQNADGSFSTAWFERPANSGDLNRRLNTSGHVLEWLAHSLPDEQLTDPQMIRAVEYLTNLLWENRHRNWDIGARGHALHALALYDERMFGGQPGRRTEQLGQAELSSAAVTGQEVAERWEGPQEASGVGVSRPPAVRRRMR
jgi:hypothetical protein